MDDSSFDRITRRLAVTATRRGGVTALIAGALGIAGITTSEAAVSVPPLCRGTGSICTDGVQCCSGRCILKADGQSRCARKTSNRKKKAKGKDDGETCVGYGETCADQPDCCDALAECIAVFTTPVCCVPTLGACTQDTDCCMYPAPSSNDVCFEGTCQPASG